MQRANGVEDGLEASAELAIVAIVETLEIDFVEVDPGVEIFEDLRRAVADGDEGGEESGFARLAEDGDRPFAGDQRLVVSADHDFESGFERRRDSVWIAQSLGGDPVLTVRAVQIAAEHAEAVGERSRISVEEWLLLDGIALHSGNVTPGNVELAAVIEADFADAGLSIGNGAAVAAGQP